MSAIKLHVSLHVYVNHFAIFYFLISLLDQANKANTHVAGKISLSRKRARARHRARSFGVCIGFVGSNKEIKE